MINKFAGNLNGLSKNLQQYRFQRKEQDIN